MDNVKKLSEKAKRALKHFLKIILKDLIIYSIILITKKFKNSKIFLMKKELKEIQYLFLEMEDLHPQLLRFLMI